MALTLTEAALDWALTHARNYGDTDIFPHAFEFDAIADGWIDVRAWLREADILRWTVRPYRRCLVPKHKFGFRVSTQLDPLDFLVLTALVREVGATLEQQRIPLNQNVVHSYRFAPEADGRMYSHDFTYRSFQLASHALCEEHHPSHVVVADIADFFPRIYGHRVSNALESALGIGHQHAKALQDLVAHWAGTYSYGIPVGSAASRLIAELTISDIDQLMLSEGASYVRYSDDFRFFCNSRAEAFKRLTQVARGLFDNHGLTLQQSKTKILTTEEFRRVYLRENDKREVDTLSERFYELLGELGIDDTYQDIDFDLLDEEQQREIVNLNLSGILEEQIAEEEPDLALLKFLLRRLAQLGSTDAIEIVFDNFDKFVPVIRETIDYLMHLSGLPADRKADLGQKLLAVYDDGRSPAASLEYIRMYLLRPFATDRLWNSDERYVQLWNGAVDEFTKRELLLAMGRSGQAFWMRGRKQYLHELNPWQRRAYIYAASCLPADEYRHWIRGVQAQLDPVERAVANWAKKNPINA